MSLKSIISRWLDPEAHEQARRYGVLRSYLDDAQRWLGYEWPEVDAAIFWARVSEVNNFRKLGDQSVEAVPGKPWIHTISEFREHLRQDSARADDNHKALVERMRQQIPVTKAYLVQNGIDPHFADVLLSHYGDFANELAAFQSRQEEK